MDAVTAIAKNTARLERTTSRRFPIPPTARVSGPRLELAVGDQDQPYWVASIDKVFIATLLGQLFEEGACAPDSPLGALLPTSDYGFLPSAPGIDNARDVTVAHLLSHTSGLADVCLPPKGYASACSIDQFEKHPERVWTIPELLAEGEHLPPIGKPGERFTYSDTAYLLLIRIIEECAVRSFADQLRTRIFEPCEMTTAARWVNADAKQVEQLTPELAPFWLYTPGTEGWRDFAPNLTWSSGMGGPASVTDLLRFQRALHAGELCDPRWIELFSAPRNSLTGGVFYGTGMVFLRFEKFFPLLRGYPHPIGGLGYTATHMFYYPEQDTHVVLNFHSWKRMQASFTAHIRLARMIKEFG